jgi:hypothetical protein
MAVNIKITVFCLIKVIVIVTLFTLNTPDSYVWLKHVGRYDYELKTGCTRYYLEALYVTSVFCILLVCDIV